MTVICGFDVQRKDGIISGWTVPVTIEAIPKDEEIHYFTEEVNNMTDEHEVLNCYAIYSDIGVKIWEDDSITPEDIAEIFEVSNRWSFN